MSDRKQRKEVETPTKEHVMELLDAEENFSILQGQIELYPDLPVKPHTQVTMRRGSKKVSIFENLKGAHSSRFISSNTMPEHCSKFLPEPVMIKLGKHTGRDIPVEYPYVMPFPEHMPDYEPSYSQVHKRLNTGFVDMNR